MSQSPVGLEVYWQADGEPLEGGLIGEAKGEAIRQNLADHCC
jgi:hypothetical protein